MFFTCMLNGGLGNQLFQLSTLYAFSKKNGSLIMLDKEVIVSSLLSVGSNSSTNSFEAMLFYILVKHRIGKNGFDHLTPLTISFPTEFVAPVAQFPLSQLNRKPVQLTEVS